MRRLEVYLAGIGLACFLAATITSAHTSKNVPRYMVSVYQDAALISSVTIDNEPEVLCTGVVKYKHGKETVKVVGGLVIVRYITE